MDRSPLITDAPQGHSPAARIERLTAQRDALLEAVRYARDQAIAGLMYDPTNDYLSRIESECSPIIRAVEEDTANTTDATKDIQARRDTAALPMVDADGWDPAGDADGHS